MRKVCINCKYNKTCKYINKTCPDFERKEKGERRVEERRKIEARPFGKGPR